MVESQFRQRQTKLAEEASHHDLGAILLNPGPDLVYLTGLEFHLMERPVLAVFPAKGEPLLILPELESAKVSGLGFAIKPYFYGEDQSTWPDVIRKALGDTGLSATRLGVIPRRLRLLEYNFLTEACPQLDFQSAQEAISRLRIVKSSEEAELMAEAARVAECALAAVLPLIQPGITEKALASKLVSRLYHEGSDPELPFYPIVSFAENTANPHAAPTDRVLHDGDLVLFDWGASIGGYFSDITRTFALGDPHPELEQIAQFVREANRAGRAAVKPGVPASQVDRAAREVIEAAGYGEYFTHRTGHGLGREAHEEPYISQFDQTVLEPGMTFTIEPGIYLPGRGGVRIEDNLLVTPEGGRSLTGMPRGLTKLVVESSTQNRSINPS
jgi:Xaa-Pro dipeptidase